MIILFTPFVSPILINKFFCYYSEKMQDIEQESNQENLQVQISTK